MSQIWLVAIAAFALLSPPPDCSTCAHPLVADGFRADGSSPFILQGGLIGTNAIWQVLIGPVDSATVTTIPPSGATFGGAGCRAEYRQGRITVQDDDRGNSSLSRNAGVSEAPAKREPAALSGVEGGAEGSALTLDVYLFRCEPSPPSGASLANGIYSVVGGTGKFSAVTGGTGSIQFDARSDGRVYCHIQGFVQGGNPPADSEQ